mmetsp:Transcript_2855/g.7487  ORF Transcript_2855/g.7487 Transcript_2855/m.7487 type:complete len:337 (+) Transcript_2855:125-1135(+)
MVDALVRGGIVRQLEDLAAGQLVVLVLGQVQDLLLVGAGNFHVRELRAERLFAEGLVRAPARALAGAAAGADHLHARVGRVVGPLPFLPVVVPDVVRVLLLELVPGDLAGEGLLPEHQRLLQRQANPLEEETKLHPAKVLQVMVVLELVVGLPHAQGEVVLGQRRQVADGRHAAAGPLAARARLRVVRPKVLPRQALDNGGEAGALLVLSDVHPGLCRDEEALLELLLELADNEGRDLVVRDVGLAPVKEDPPRPDQLGHLLKGHFEEGLGALLRGGLADPVRVDAAVVALDGGHELVPQRGELPLVQRLDGHAVAREKGLLLGRQKHLEAAPQQL